MGSHSFFQGIFPTQGSNLSLLVAGGFFTIWAMRKTRYSHKFQLKQHPRCPARKSLSFFSASLTSEPWYVQMKHYFWVCLWGCFWVRLAIQSVDSAKEMALFCAGEHHLIHGGLNRTKRRGRRIHPILLSARLLHLWSLISSFPALELVVKPLNPWFLAFGLCLNYITHQLSWVSILQLVDGGTSQSP